MTNEWILDVLADLKTFAAKNGMNRLERQLVLAAHVAVEDLASGKPIAPAGVSRGMDHAGIVYRTTSGGPNA